MAEGAAIVETAIMFVSAVESTNAYTIWPKNHGWKSYLFSYYNTYICNHIQSNSVKTNSSEPAIFVRYNRGSL